MIKDQAEELRLKFQQNSHTKLINKEESFTNTPRTIAVVSGKGGVGKSNISLSFSISLCLEGKKVLLFDMDLGMGNLDILMGRSSDYSIIDFFDGKVGLEDIIYDGPSGLKYIAGGSGLNHLVGLDERNVSIFLNELSSVISNYDYIIFDMGAGVTKESLKFILSVQDIIVVTTPEPTSITDAYAMMKHIHLSDSTIPFHLIINRVQDEQEGISTFNRLERVLTNFLHREATYLGAIPDDKHLQQAVRNQTPFILHNEKSLAARSLLKIRNSFEHKENKMSEVRKQKPFIAKLKQFLFDR